MSELVKIKANKSKEKTVVFQDLGILEYNQTLTLQTDTRSQKIENPVLPDQLFFVEHPPVFTFGKNGGRENLVVTDAFLAEQSVDTVQTERGGNITYHGTGQAVLYPVIDLKRSRIGVADFVYGLEEIMKQTALYFGVQADRDPKNHGLWVGSSKIGSVGLSIKKNISIHGLAMNISPDLTPFSWINPCGLENVSITSIKKELETSGNKTNSLLVSKTKMPTIKMTDIQKIFITEFCKIFNFKMIEEKNNV